MRIYSTATTSRSIITRVGVRKARVIAWFISIALLAALGVAYFIVTPFITEYYQEGGGLIGVAFFTQDLVLALPMVLLIIAVLAHARAPEGPERALRYYFITLAAVLVADSYIWWTSVASRHINPGPIPGEDWGAGLMAFGLAILGPFLVLAVELTLKFCRVILRRAHRPN